jgi:carboxyl-terminal processing protease
MRAGDQILKIDGAETAPMTSEDAVSKMRGRPGSPVVLTVIHQGDADAFDLSVVREIITVQSVLGDRRLSDGSWDYHLGVDNRIGYLRITTFGKHTVEELNRVMADGSNRDFEALVLDLRNNAGGLLNAAVGTCDLFIDRGQIVSTRGRDSVFGKNYKATSAIAVPYSKPIAVVVNGYSASASEIVAACLQDYKRAAIVGQRTYGKGTVQNILPLEGGQSALRLTTATYWRPSGENIHRAKDVADDAAWGVSPDGEFEVVLDDEEAKNLFDQRRQRDLVEEVRRSSPESEIGASPGETADRQLDSAIDYLRERLERNN